MSIMPSTVLTSNSPVTVVSSPDSPNSLNVAARVQAILISTRDRLGLDVPDSVLADLCAAQGDGLPADEFRPTFLDTFEVSPEADAEWEGLVSGLIGHPCIVPSNYSDAEQRAYALGHAAGAAEYESDELSTWDDDQQTLDTMFADPLDSIDPSELTEGLGSLAARQIGADI